ncbi:MAG: M28 family peptidase [Gemmataceae bacterium]|jgi:hypothetical protein|nr:M28 family peptidase [Gemmataceae bacterium]
MNQSSMWIVRLGMFSLMGAALMLNSCGGIGAQSTKEKFAEGRDGEPVKAGPFDGERAMGYLKTLCDLGTRWSNSKEMLKQQELLTAHFEKHGAKVTLQKFMGRQPSVKDPIPLANMIVTWHPEAKRRVLICGHYDTRPIAHEEPRKNWDKPFLSANDGTSTVAFLMELAHHMKDLKLEVGVDFVLFDAEEYIFDKSRDKFFLGSEFFANDYKKNPPKHKYIAGILLDLFAHKGAEYRVELNSYDMAKELVTEIWAIAKKEGVRAFVWDQGLEIQDDHLALNAVGIPTIDIIDLKGYEEHWHKLSDTPDKCSANSMNQVAKVILAWLPKVK